MYLFLEYKGVLNSLKTYLKKTNIVKIKTKIPIEKTHTPLLYYEGT